MNRFLDILKSYFSRAFRYTGLFALAFVCRPGRRRGFVPDRPESFLILSQEKLGDAILLTPLFRAIREHFPTAFISVLATNRNLQLFRVLDDVDEVICPKSKFLRFLKIISRRHFQVLYNPKDHPSRTYLFLSLWIKADLKVGHPHILANRFYDVLVKGSGSPYIADQNLSLLSVWGIEADSDRYPPRLPEYRSEDIDRFFMHVTRPMIGVNLSSGERIREWPVARVRVLLDEFSGRSVTFLLFGMEDKIPAMKTIQSQYDNVLILEPRKNLLELAGYVQKLDALITPDTALYHLAKMVQIPVIVLFQNRMENCLKFFKPDENSRALISPSRDIRDIMPESVLAALNSLLAGAPCESHM